VVGVAVAVGGIGVGVAVEVAVAVGVSVAVGSGGTMSKVKVARAPVVGSSAATTTSGRSDQGRTTGMLKMTLKVPSSPTVVVRRSRGVSKSVSGATSRSVMT
jgi:hypothetical protein